MCVHGVWLALMQTFMQNARNVGPWYEKWLGVKKNIKKGNSAKVTIKTAPYQCITWALREYHYASWVTQLTRNGATTVSMFHVVKGQLHQNFLPAKFAINVVHISSNQSWQSRRIGNCHLSFLSLMALRDSTLEDATQTLTHCLRDPQRAAAYWKSCCGALLALNVLFFRVTSDKW